MIRNTFLHIAGVGEKTERAVWERGIHTWPELLDAVPASLPASLRGMEGAAVVEESIRRYDRGDWRYFEERIPGVAKWRAFRDLGQRVLYVDIETDGFNNEITVIGVYDGQSFRAFVANENLDEALEVLEGASLVVTYNGTGFDMPIIRSRFPYHLFNHIHVDLMWPLRRLGLKGGLKRIEEKLGLVRSDETRNMSGWDAVYLWREYQRGSQEAKVRLLQYNEEDVRNLEPLMRWVDETLRGRVAVTLRP